MDLTLTWSAIIALVVLTTALHGLGIVLMTRTLKLEQPRLQALQVGPKAFLLLTGVTLFLFVLHVLEISIFALFFIQVGAIAGLGDAMNYSAAAYSTLGSANVPIAAEWELVGSLEGVVGFLLLGWSTAVLVTDMNTVLRE